MTVERGEVRSPIVVGVDFAQVKDYSAVVIVAGTSEQAMVVEAHRVPRSDWNTQLEFIRERISPYPLATVIVDATGVGRGLSSTLAFHLPEWTREEFVFTADSKSRIIFALIRAFEAGTLKTPPDRTLLRELANFRGTRNELGHTRFEAASGEHDDLIMALAMAYFKLPTTLGSSVRTGDKRKLCTYLANSD